VRPDSAGTFTLPEAPSSAWRTNARTQRRGPHHPQPLTEPKSRNAPLFPRPLQCVVRPPRLYLRMSFGYFVGSNRTFPSLPMLHGSLSSRM